MRTASLLKAIINSLETLAVRLLDLTDLFYFLLSLTFRRGAVNAAANTMSSEVAALEKEIQEYRLQVKSCQFADAHG